ncbi:putative SGNH hydrolase-type esterase domain-containing protein [Medicago truncatula]|uniref:GDSL-like lipase/acylhydrolase n=1 Tax=Medicago truncatula TaxID=3880 RepID=A0A072TNE0_MEDTR|nr:GDSL esterase/lipase 1 [Medicago truncatula]KEH18902.1 GDSL-like lipase/acylhydrolase [Medicago truncatula]RHN39938.1 putative SGNH hydrolase-type esterase domain-containing protein [Medicago truncatula]
MASEKFNFGFLIFFLCYGILISTQCLGNICVPKEHVALFVFGDSFFDVGNNNYINTTTDLLANYPPYGETFFKYPSGRFSDGRVIPDFIAEYAKLPLIQPYLFPGSQLYINGVNFASAGAGALVETHQGLVTDLKTQLTYLKNVKKVLRQRLGDEETTTLLAKAVYLINIGGNDYFVENSSLYTHEKYVSMVVGNLTTVIKRIHEIGGRKFGILNQPSFGCFPIIKALVNGTKSGSCIEEYSALAKVHNTKLSVELHNLTKQIKGFKYSYFDLYHLSFEVISNPSKFGLKEGGVACCGSGPYNGYHSCGGKREVKDYDLCDNPSEYLLFDSTHPTEAGSRIISQYMWSGNQTITGPYNLKTLFEE